MLKIATLLSAALIVALCGPASAQYGSEDPRFEEDPRDEPVDPREEKDPREEDVLAREAELIETLSTHQLFDALYEKDDRQALATAFGESSWELLDYLDKMCESWHAMVEGGALENDTRRLEADSLRERCLDTARLCDEVTGETTLFLYTDRQFAWDAEERVAFREGQAQLALALRLVDQAADSDDLSLALTPLGRALNTARILGDTWGQTKALTLTARIHAANDDLDAAATTMLDGLTLGRQIHDLDTVWVALSMRYSAAIEGALWEEAEATLEDQYNLAIELGDEPTAIQIMERLVELDDYVSTLSN